MESYPFELNYDDFGCDIQVLESSLGAHSFVISTGQCMQSQVFRKVTSLLSIVQGCGGLQCTQPVQTLFLFKSIWIRPQRSQGCQKMRQDPLNMPFEVWCANIAPERHKLQKTIKIGKKC